MLYSRVHESTNTFPSCSLHGKWITEAEEEIGKEVTQRSWKELLIRISWEDFLSFPPFPFFPFHLVIHSPFQCTLFTLVSFSLRLLRTIFLSSPSLSVLFSILPGENMNIRITCLSFLERIIIISPKKSEAGREGYFFDVCNNSRR